MDLCETCIHARDSEGQPICHGFRWLVNVSLEMAAAINEDDIPIMSLAQPLFAVTECRAYESNERPAVKLLALVKN